MRPFRDFYDSTLNGRRSGKDVSRVYSRSDSMNDALFRSVKVVVTFRKEREIGPGSCFYAISSGRCHVTPSAPRLSDGQNLA